jgi:hypothetical protein
LNATLRVGVFSSLTFAALVMFVAAGIDATGCSSGDIAVGSTSGAALAHQARGLAPAARPDYGPFAHKIGRGA